jgi:hypothetical protein
VNMRKDGKRRLIEEDKKRSSTLSETRDFDVNIAQIDLHCSGHEFNANGSNTGV